MSLLGDAFDGVVSLLETEIKPGIRAALDPIGQIQDAFIDEPLYIDSTTESGRNASRISKRVSTP